MGFRPIVAGELAKQLVATLMALAFSLCTFAQGNGILRQTQSAMDNAISNRDTEVIKKLCMSPYLFINERRGLRGNGSYLVAAVIGGSTDVIQALLDCGARFISSAQIDGGSIFITLASKNDVTTTKYVISKIRLELLQVTHGDEKQTKASLISWLDAPAGAQGVSALMVAYEHGHVEVGEVLLDNGARGDYVDDSDHTVAWHASTTNPRCVECLKQLKEHGIDPTIM